MTDDDWTRLRSRYVGEFRVVRLREDRYRFEPTQAETDFIVCESADWVLVIPVTADGQVVFIRQYRHGIRRTVLEIPGGLLEAGESAETAADRELREETGFAAGCLRYLARLMPNPALNDAHCHVVLAEDCRQVGEPTPDAFERIELDMRPLAAVPEMIASGELSHALVLAAFACYGPTVNHGKP
jgi:8-oxo-dGTP pyrophosphatase MutT (NUDIX family)